MKLIRFFLIQVNFVHLYTLLKINTFFKDFTKKSINS